MITKQNKNTLPYSVIVKTWANKNTEKKTNNDKKKQKTKKNNNTIFMCIPQPDVDHYDDDGEIGVCSHKSIGVRVCNEIEY